MSTLKHNDATDRPDETDRPSLTEELRLRRWARENYVPRGERLSTWHPIILDEMAFKDAELHDVSEPRSRAKDIVPLMPMLRVVRPSEPIVEEEEIADEVAGTINIPQPHFLAPAPSRVRMTMPATGGALELDD